MQWLSRAVLAAALLGCAVPRALAENDTQSRAGTCANDTDLAAFRTAAVQQQLMVAALTCKDVEAYNRFVLAYQPELVKSDGDLKSYFTRRGNVAEYDTFKTKLANLSSLSTIANGPAYCENAAAAFDMALKNRQSLSSFVADQRLMIAMPQQAMCTAPKPRPELQMAAAKSAPMQSVAAKLPPLQVIAVRNAPVKPVPEPEAAPPVRMAAAAPSVPVKEAPVRVADNKPAAVVVEAPAAPRVYAEASYAPEATELPLPPRPPRTREASRLEAYYAAQYAQAPRRWNADSYYYPGR